MDEIEPQDAEPVAGETELVEGVIVLASARTIEPVRGPAPPMRRLAAVAATGFVAGAATAAVVGRRVARAQQARALPASPPREAPLAGPVRIVAVGRLHVRAHSLARR
jgi:hypothetical protein